MFLKPKLNVMIPSIPQLLRSEIKNDQTDLNEILYKNLCLDENGAFEPEAKVKPPSYKLLKGKVYNGYANRPLNIVELLDANIYITLVFVVS